MSGPSGGDAEQRQRTARRQGIAYQGATEAFVAILICMGLGVWADQRFDTSPTFLLIGTGIGFASFVLRLLRLGRQLERFKEGPDAGAGPPAKGSR